MNYVFVFVLAEGTAKVYGLNGTSIMVSVVPRFGDQLSRRLSSDSHMCAEAYSGHVYQSINKHNKILKFKKQK